MKNNIKKCIITRYDETIKEAPFLTIPIDVVEINEPENDDHGVDLYNILCNACRSKGYTFKFYTMCRDKQNDYEIVVY
jgi:hypothetical protein